MASEKKYTERDLVLAKREGYARHCVAVCGNTKNATELAARTYPLPRVTRPRVWVDPNGDTRFQVVDGVLFGKDFEEDEEWLPVDSYAFNVTPERVVAWADLFANPTEEVDDDGA